MPRRSFADWPSSKAGDGAVSKNFAIVAMPGRRAAAAQFVPADYEKRLVKNDFAWSAKNRDKILAEWIKRYDAKSEPKK